MTAGTNVACDLLAERLVDQRLKILRVGWETKLSEHAPYVARNWPVSEIGSKNFFLIISPVKLGYHESMKYTPLWLINLCSHSIDFDF